MKIGFELDPIVSLEVELVSIVSLWNFELGPIVLLEFEVVSIVSLWVERVSIVSLEVEVVSIVSLWVEQVSIVSLEVELFPTRSDFYRSSAHEIENFCTLSRLHFELSSLMSLLNIHLRRMQQPTEIWKKTCHRRIRHCCLRRMQQPTEM